jgi:hypothetical protein
MPHLCRWFLTCVHHPSFVAVLGDQVAPAFKLMLGKDLKEAPPLPAIPKTPSASSSSSSSFSSSAAAKKKGGTASAAPGKAATPASAGGGNGQKAAATATTTTTATLKPGTAQAAAAEALASVPPLELKFTRTRTTIKDVVNVATTTTTTAAAAAGNVGGGGGVVSLGSCVVVKGWARTVRAANKGKLLFVVLNDGSTAHDLQCVVDSSCPGFDAALPAKSGGTGAAFSVEGTVVASKGNGQQAVEVQATKVEVVGPVYAGETTAEGADGGELAVGGAKYPLAKKGHSLEYMRSLAHLRPRTKAYASTMR